MYVSMVQEDGPVRQRTTICQQRSNNKESFCEMNDNGQIIFSIIFSIFTCRSTSACIPFHF